MRKCSKDTKTAWLFISPYVLGFIIFLFIPLVASFALSFTDVRYISKLKEMNFIGIKNYIEMFSDSRFLDSLGRSILFTAMYVPLVVIASLLLAVLVNKKIFARNTIRAMFFMPYISNIVAISIVWAILLEPTEGIINNLLRSIGISNPPIWLWGTNTALFSLVIISAWQALGLTFVIYLAALQNVPLEIKEAANIDGANKFQVFKYVTVPFIAPATLLVIITALTGSLKNFTIIQVMTNGGPGSSTEVLPLVIVETAFGSYRMGYASAQAIILFAIITILTLMQWKFNHKRHDR